MSSSPEKYFIFGKGKKGNEGGGREIFPVGYPREKSKIAYSASDFGTFEMVDGSNSQPAKYLEDLDKTWIPFDISEPSKKGNINKDPSYNEVLIMFGKLHFGAIWNEELAQFEQTDESSAWHFTKAIDKTKYLASFHNMNYPDFQRASSDKDRFHYDDAGNLKFIDGFGTDKMTRYKSVLLAYDNPTKANIEKGIKKVLGKKQTGAERGRARRELLAKPETATEADDVVRNKFEIQPYIQQWKDKLADRKIQDPQSKVSAIFRIFAINNILFKPESLTTGLKGQSLEDKINTLKEIVAVWKRWNSSFRTDKKFYETSWKDPLYKAGKVDLHFPTGIWEGLAKFPERDHKRGKPRKFDPDKKMESARKTAADLLVSYVVNAPKDSWTIEKQPAETMLSRKIGTPSYGDQGQNITDKHVREAMKFLETGKKHDWQHMKKDGRLVYEQLKIKKEDQTLKDEFIAIEELVELEDNDSHYNTALKEYDWSDDGSPYGKTKPASLLFRIGLLSGWRKMEGLTCPTRITSKKKLKENKKFWKEGVSYREKPSGIIMDKIKGILDIAFLTRKTKKTGAGFFEAIIPPFSSSVMDTRDTIAYVMEKAGIGKWKDPDYYNWKKADVILGEDDKPTPVMLRFPKKEWKGEVVAFEEDELKTIFPELKVKGKIVREKGEKASVLIGEDGQFFSRLTFETKEGKSMAIYDAPSGSDLSKFENKDAVRAYLDFPLMEAYAQMKGTTVHYESDIGILKKATDDRDTMKELNPKWNLKVFRLENKWANTCYLGCRKDEVGQIRKGEYSKDRMDQDVLRYLTDEEDWWLGRTIHSIRHIFAQLWLRKSQWNFGIVADRGHWETLDTLKKHYGDVPPTVQAGFMIQVLSASEIGADKFNQGQDAGIAGQIASSGVAEVMAETQIQESEEEAEGVVVESEAETEKKMEKEVADV